MTTRWMKCSVRAKSGTSFEREMRRRMEITLFFFILTPHKVIDQERPRKDREQRRKEEAYPNKEFKSHTSPSIHPTVVSPLRLRQLSTRSKLKCFPATSAVNRISAVATEYHITCSITICERILRGGSSVSAPERGGRRRRAMDMRYVCVIREVDVLATVGAAFIYAGVLRGERIVLGCGMEWDDEKGTESWMDWGWRLGR